MFVYPTEDFIYHLIRTTIVTPRNIDVRSHVPHILLALYGIPLSFNTTEIYSLVMSDKHFCGKNVYLGNILHFVNVILFSGTSIY